MTTQPNAEWEAEYEPQDLGEESLLHPLSKVRSQPKRKVWSVVEDREGRLVAVAGRLSNTSCLDYAVTKKPWTTGDERGYWLPLDAEKELGYMRGEPRDLTGWGTEQCDLNDDCDGTPPEDHLFPPEGRSVTTLRHDQCREVGGTGPDHDDTFHALPEGTVGEVVIVDADIHMVAILVNGRRYWVDPINLTNTP